MNKRRAFISLFLLIFVGFSVKAQTADEIISTYIKNIGGAEKLKNITGTKMEMSVNYQGMDIPVELVQLKEGKIYLKINFQGQEITQMAFDGTTAWSTNFMTLQAEKMDDEMAQNIKDEAADFPNPMYNYLAKGFSIEYAGKETKEGTEFYKIKLTKKPATVEGQKVDNIVFYYFDTKTYLPMMTETEVKSGPAKGQISTSTMGDYQAVDGVLFPFTINQAGQSMKVVKITLNPTVDEASFAFKE